jgi:hypothetical protein
LTSTGFVGGGRVGVAAILGAGVVALFLLCNSKMLVPLLLSSHLFTVQLFVMIVFISLEKFVTKPLKLLIFYSSFSLRYSMWRVSSSQAAPIFSLASSNPIFKLFSFFKNNQY